MPSVGGSINVSPSLSSVIAFKPRQVLLAEQRRSLAGSAPMAKNTAQLKPDDESILTCSIALWLENKGFSKVLKRFLSAAEIQDDNWKARALNLNDIFSKYQEMCNGAHEDLKSQKKQEVKVVASAEKNGDLNHTMLGETECNKKKKKDKGDKAVTDPGRTPKEMSALPESNDEKVCKLTAESAKIQKDKKKKRSKSTSDSLDVDEKQIDAAPGVNESEDKGLSTKSSDSKDDQQDLVESKDKKKKKKLKRENVRDADNCDLGNEKKVLADKDDGGIELKSNPVQVEKNIIKNEDTIPMELSKKKSAEAAEDGVIEQKKSKKRKRIAPGENENQPGQEVAVEESKPKKTKSLAEYKDAPSQMRTSEANGHHKEQNKEDKFQINCAGTPNLFAKQTDESTNNKGVDAKTQTKSARKQRNGSAEPKTVNAFQRVKIEEVKFADERLQDNSYWAKDGAEIGYGAKAQEVLGQVKGRDFRHEKTKKKRGSYRGGQIDLQSHSVKFNYSDDE